MNYKNIYEQVKTELALEHNIILDINDPIIFASYLQMKITSVEIDKINEKHISEVKNLQEKLETEIYRNQSYLKEEKGKLENIISNKLDKYLYYAIIISSLVFFAGLMIGKHFLK